YNGLTTSQLEKINNTEVTITIYLDKNGQIIAKKYSKNTILNSLI
ncbi:competence protein ComEC, partial [Spiroplasma sp. ChiS]